MEWANRGFDFSLHTAGENPMQRAERGNAFSLSTAGQNPVQRTTKGNAFLLYTAGDYPNMDQLLVEVSKQVDTIKQQ
jgi:hypothetical protein